MIRFYAQALGEIRLFTDHGQALLAQIGKSAEQRAGVLTCDELAAALSALNDQALTAVTLPGDSIEDDDAAQATITLAQRAWPLKDMITRAIAKQSPILWEAI